MHSHSNRLLVITFFYKNIIFKNHHLFQMAILNIFCQIPHLEKSYEMMDLNQIIKIDILQNNSSKIDDALFLKNRQS